MSLDQMRVEVNGPQKVSPDISLTDEPGVFQIMYRVTIPGEYEIIGFVAGDEIYHMKATVKDINDRGRRQNTEQPNTSPRGMRVSERNYAQKTKSTQKEEELVPNEGEREGKEDKSAVPAEENARSVAKGIQEGKSPEQSAPLPQAQGQFLFQPLDKLTLLKKISNDPEKQMRLEKIQAMKQQDKEFKLQRRETQRAQELEILYQMKQWDDLFQEVEHSQQQVMKSQNILEIIEQDTEHWMTILQSNTSSISDISDKIKIDTDKWDSLVKNMESRSLESKVSQRTLSMAKRHVEKIKKDISESIPVVKNVITTDESKNTLARKVTGQNKETQRKIQNLLMRQAKVPEFPVVKEEKVTDISELLKSIEEWKNILEIPEWTPRVSLAKIKEIQRRIYEDQKDWEDVFSVTEFIGGENMKHNTKLKDIGAKIEKDREDWNHLVEQVEVVDIALTRVREILFSIEECINDPSILHVTQKDPSFQKIKNHIGVWVDLLQKAQYLKDKIKLLIIEEEGDWKKITTMLKEFKDPVKSSEILSKIKKDVVNWNPVNQMIADLEKMNWFSVADVTDMIDNADNWLEVIGNKKKEEKMIVKPPSLQEIEGEAINNQEVPQQALSQNSNTNQYLEEIQRLNQMVASLTAQIATLSSK